MAPDINSLGPPPNLRTTQTRPSGTDQRATNTSQRASISTHSPTFSPQDPPIAMAASSGIPPDDTGVGPGPGPLRHPRPLTAADLHMQLEKEQEAVVNRLTRELTLLRQQSTSVASTTSSASNSMSESAVEAAGTSGSSLQPTHTSRHRSSSSNLSARNAHGITGGSHNSALPAASIGATGAAGIAPPREPAMSHASSRDPLSRQSSVASRRSEASSPPLSSSLVQGDHFPTLYARRGSTSQAHHQGAVGGNPRSSHAAVPSRHEELHLARAEIDSVRRENEDLRHRVRELERALRQRHSGSHHQRSTSVSTNASLPDTANLHLQDTEGIGVAGTSRNE